MNFENLSVLYFAVAVTLNYMKSVNNTLLAQKTLDMFMKYYIHNTANPPFVCITPKVDFL